MKYDWTKRELLCQVKGIVIKIFTRIYFCLPETIRSIIMIHYKKTAFIKRKKIIMENPEKILFFQFPEFATEQDYAILWATLSRENALPWLYNSFVQIRGFKYYASGFLLFDEADLAFENCPFYDYQYIDRDTFRIMDSAAAICSIFINLLKNGYYIYLMLDQYYNPNNKNYFLQNHFAHNTFIYGYNQEKAVFYIADFYDHFYAAGKSIAFEAFLSAYNLEHCKNQDWIRYKPTRCKLELGSKIKLFKYTGTRYSFNVPHFRERLSDYLHSRNAKQRLDEQEEAEARGFIYGLDNYRYLISAMEYIRENDKYSLNTIKALHLLYSHKKILCACLDYLSGSKLLNNDQVIMEKFREIKTASSFLVPIFLKYNFSRKMLLLSGIQHRLENLYTKEKNVLPMLIDCLVENDSCVYYQQFRELEARRFHNEVEKTYKNI